jgi:hypothetical protein
LQLYSKLALSLKKQKTAYRRQNTAGKNLSRKHPGGIDSIKAFHRAGENGNTRKKGREG